MSLRMRRRSCVANTTLRHQRLLRSARNVHLHPTPPPRTRLRIPQRRPYKALIRQKIRRDIDNIAKEAVSGCDRCAKPGPIFMLHGKHIGLRLISNNFVCTSGSLSLAILSRLDDTVCSYRIRNSGQLHLEIYL